jgi:uncharacterized protein YndB with AHSA1/START domain
MTQQLNLGTAADLGSVRPIDDGYELQFDRFLAYPVERVWSALTDSAELAKWFAPGGIDLKVGGAVKLMFSADSGVTGNVTAISAPHLLEYTWIDKDGDNGVVRWELRAEGDGTLLILRHNVPKEAQALGLPMLAGWHSLLANLVEFADGSEVTNPDGRWQALHDHYAELGAMDGIAG